MKSLEFKTNTEFFGTNEILKKMLDKNVDLFQSDITYANTEAALVEIVSGCIDYFYKLDNTFLGEGNVQGVPSMEADHFANNLYRLLNSIDYLGKLWKLKVVEPQELKLLKDIRTLIVHSGEQLSKIESLELENYKDSQLGRILKKGSQRAFPFPEAYSKADYCIEIWNDKHSKGKQYNISQVDYHIENDSYYDCSIYLSSIDIRNFILSYIENFFKGADSVKLLIKSKKLPMIKDKVIDRKNHEIDFDRIAGLISKDTRGGYIKEQGLVHWSGFGLQRLYQYTKNARNIKVRTRELILTKIEEVISEFWDNYQNKDFLDDELPNLDIRNVFGDFTPSYKLKGYLEGEKLFYKIAPFFNVDSKGDATDIDYLLRFVSEINVALNTEFNLEQNVDGLICEYFVRSVESKLE